MGVVRDLVTRFRFVTDSRGAVKARVETAKLTKEMRRQAWQAKRARMAFRQMAYGIRNLVAAYLGFRTIKSLTVDLANEISDLTTNAMVLGLTAKQLDALRMGFESLTLDASKADATVRYLVQGIADATRGSGLAAEALKSLGLSADELAKLPVGEQLNVVLNRLHGIRNETKQLQVAQNLAGRRGGLFLAMLARRYDDVSKAIREADRSGILFGRGYKSFDKMAVQAAVLKRQWRALRVELGVELAKVLLPLLKNLREWLADEKHRKQLVGFVKALGGILATMAALKIWGYLKAAKAMLAGVIPWLVRIGAKLTWIRYLFTGIGGAVTALAAVIAAAGYTIYKALTWGPTAAQDAWEGFKLMLSDLAAWFQRIWQEIVGTVRDAVNEIIKLVDRAKSAILGLPSRAWGKVKSGVKWLGGKLGISSVGGGEIGFTLPKIPIPQGAAGGTKVSVGSVTVSVDGQPVGSPAELGSAVRRGIETGMGRVVATAGGAP